MPNKMIRPCTLWGETFDACDVKAVNDYLTFEEESASPSMGYSCSVLIRDPFKGDIASPVYKNKIESYKAIAEAITTIAEALNAPVLATEEVLAGLEYKEVIGYCDAGLQHSGVVGNFAGTWKLNRGSWGLMDFGLEDCGIYKVKAKEDDPKTAEYLRQFTLDGVRINKEKES